LQLFNNLLPLKTDVNIPAVSNKQKKKFFGILKDTEEETRTQILNSVDPDPYHNVTDPKDCKTGQQSSTFSSTVGVTEPVMCSSDFDSSLSI
jgi:hypothetical protein